MKTMQIRLAAMLILSGLLSAIAGCGGNPARATAKPSNADFSIEFVMDGSGKPTGMTIAPDDGDAWLDVVKQPGPRDNPVVWTSKSEFEIRFGQIDDPQLPLKRQKPSSRNIVSNIKKAEWFRSQILMSHNLFGQVVATQML